MNLLSKLQDRLHGKPEDKTSGTPSVNDLDKLPDAEKLKVLDYLSAVKDLHKEPHGQ